MLALAGADDAAAGQLHAVVGGGIAASDADVPLDAAVEGCVPI